MNRSFVNLLLAAAFACVGSSAVIAQQPDTEQQINEPGEEVITRIVTTEFSEDQMEELQTFSQAISQHNPEWRTFFNNCIKRDCRR